MKKLLLIAAACFCMTVGAQAQAITMTGDTIVNAATVTAVTQVKLQYTTLTVQVKLTKISGTVAGTSELQGSVDGTNYETIAGTDTLTHTNVASQFHVWILPKADYLYYRIKSVGSGTMSAIMTGLLLPKK